MTFYVAPLPTPWKIHPVLLGEFKGKFYIHRLVADKEKMTGVAPKYLRADGTIGDSVIVDGVSVGHFDTEEEAEALLNGTGAAA